MAEERVSITYIGTGGTDYEVAADTDGTANMQPGETYEVSRELASRYTYSSDWEVPDAENLREEAINRNKETNAEWFFGARDIDALAEEYQQKQAEKAQADHEAFQAESGEETPPQAPQGQAPETQEQREARERAQQASAQGEGS